MNPVRALALLSLSLSACSFDEPRKQDVLLKPYLIPCDTRIPTSCMVGAELFPSGGIEGFVFVWNQTHRLAIETYPAKEPREDGGLMGHTLVRIYSSRPDRDWNFRTIPLFTSRFSMTGEKMAIEGYPLPISIPNSADRLLLASPSIAYITLRVRPGSTDEVLLGDSVKVETMDE